jgi:hypothetical protein
MLLSSGQRSWIGFSTIFAALAAVAYGVYVAHSPYGPSGASWPGLAFGIVGTLFMLLAGLLSARKKVRTWRLGGAQTWMRMHVWLGLLAVPCIWFHSGFALGGALTTTLMVLFYAVIASGIVGLLLQQYLPSTMTLQVPFETVIGQVDYVLAGLAADAYEVVANLAGPIAEATEEQQRIASEEDVTKRRQGHWKQTPRLRPAERSDLAAQPLRDFYLSHVRPYLRGDRRGAPPDFGAVMVRSPAEWQPKLERLRAICEEARQLAVQQRLHNLLHGWLFIHAPLSIALFVLAGFHIVFALRY